MSSSVVDGDYYELEDTDSDVDVDMDDDFDVISMFDKTLYADKEELAITVIFQDFEEVLVSRKEAGNLIL